MITTRHDAETDTMVCEFRGRMDSTASQEAAEGFHAAWDVLRTGRGDLQALPAIVFDLSEVDFLTSAFFRLCLQAGRKGGRSFRVVHLSPTLKKLFMVAGLEAMAD